MAYINIVNQTHEIICSKYVELRPYFTKCEKFSSAYKPRKDRALKM
jgi:hypothetical protein